MKYETVEMQVEDIIHDPNFNCRDTFTLESVNELAESIRQDGLNFPLVVQPWQGKYRLICGFRRYQALVRILKWTKLPVMVRDDLTDAEAQRLNLSENLERKNLNILEEARALRRIYPEGVSLSRAAFELKKPTRWVHVRIRLMELPEVIQHQAASGILSAVDINSIYSLPGTAARLKEAANIARQKMAGRSTVKIAREGRCFQRKRGKREMSSLIDYMWSKGVDGLPTRVLAWAQGFITDAEIKKDIRDASKFAGTEAD